MFFFSLQAVFALFMLDIAAGSTANANFFKSNCADVILNCHSLSSHLKGRKNIWKELELKPLATKVIAITTRSSAKQVTIIGPDLKTS